MGHLKNVIVSFKGLFSWTQYFLQYFYLPFVPNNASEAGAFELTFLFAVVGGLEAIVCLFVVADTGVGRTCVEAAPRLTVLTEV